MIDAKTLADAKKIATLIADTNTGIRGDLLVAVADELRLRTQHFTARCINEAAYVYGVTTPQVKRRGN